ncbi:hypothetical protein SEA_CLOWN_4 [Gordonia phage Clown]|uniref:Uncharacterized protein n=1 Tax=Gordonia phage Clown TaxID=2759393 RepID=A0A7L7SHU8_9CAUD|nr:hypothetical protein KNV25_gp04 [Gordonia phage Clown]QOC56002.1 hypothetical protein SEA_CLOWN_4 [Gordonia phage Clown]
MTAAWEPLAAIAATIPLYWASSRAGHRWAQWRDLIRQERDLDRAARAARSQPPVRRAIPPPGNAGVVTGRMRQSAADRAAASIVPMIAHPTTLRDLDDLLRSHGILPEPNWGSNDRVGQ